MRKSLVEVTFENFYFQIYWHIDFLNKVFEAKRVVGDPYEKKELFEAFVFKVYANWNIFVEDLLIDCLNRDTSQYAQYMDIKLRKNLTRNQCKAMILGLTSYLDFRSVSEIKKIAKNILVPQNNPFIVIPKSASDKIDEFYKIRNYLAHYSILARRSLTNMYKRAYRLQRFREPGDFLHCFDRRTGQTRFGNYVHAFLEATDEMAQFLGI